jgi:carbon storage regulator
MLVLTRRIGETIVMDGNIHLKVLSIEGRKVRLGIAAPPSVGVYREEAAYRLKVKKRAADPELAGTAAAAF